MQHMVLVGLQHMVLVAVRIEFLTIKDWQLG